MRRRVFEAVKFERVLFQYLRRRLIDEMLRFPFIRHGQIGKCLLLIRRREAIDVLVELCGFEFDLMTAFEDGQCRI